MKFEEENRREQVLTREDAERACAQAAEFLAMATTLIGGEG